MAEADKREINEGLRLGYIQNAALQSCGSSARCEPILPVTQRFAGERLCHCRLCAVGWSLGDATRDIFLRQLARRRGGILAPSLPWARGVRHTECGEGLMRTSRLLGEDAEYKERTFGSIKIDETLRVRAGDERGRALLRSRCRTAHNLFNGDKIRTAVCADDLLDDVLFGINADHAIFVVDQHTTTLQVFISFAASITEVPESTVTRFFSSIVRL